MDPVRDLVTARPDFFANRAAWRDRAARINDFIFMSNGLSNAYLLTAGASRVIINTGMGFEAPTHKKVFDAVHPGGAGSKGSHSPASSRALFLNCLRRFPSTLIAQ